MSKSLSVWIAGILGLLANLTTWAVAAGQNAPTPANILEQPDDPILTGDITTNQDCLGGCMPCVKLVARDCGNTVQQDCSHALCDILYGVDPQSVVEPPIERFYSACHVEFGKRKTGKKFKGFESTHSHDPNGFKNVSWPRDVVCSELIKCECIGASLDPSIITFCTSGAATPDTVVRRTVVFDPTLTCDNVNHPAYPPEAATSGGD